MLPEDPILLLAKHYKNLNYVCGWITYQNLPVRLFYALITSEEQCEEQKTKSFFNILEEEGLHCHGICECAHQNLFPFFFFFSPLDTQLDNILQTLLQLDETIIKSDP